MAEDPAAHQSEESASPPYDPNDPVVNLERQVLKLATQHPALCGPAFDVLVPDDFSVDQHRVVQNLILGCGGARSARSAREWVARLIDVSPNDRVREFITRLAVEPIEVPNADGAPDARYAGEVLARVEELAVSRRIAELKSRLQRLNPVEAPSEHRRTFGDLVALEQRRKALVEKAAGAF
jgi:DNA primase